MSNNAHERALLEKIFGHGSDPRRALLKALSGAMDGEGRAYNPFVERVGDVDAKITAADLEAVAREVKAEGELFRNHVASQGGDNLDTLAEGFAQASAVMKKVINGSGQMTVAARAQ